MKKYDYRQAVKDSIYDYIIENEIDLSQRVGANKQELEDYENYLYELVLNDDSVTGNMFGSFFCDTYKAEECLNHNLSEFCFALNYWDIPSYDIIRFLSNPEIMDVLIRKMYVREVVCEIVKEINER